MPVSIAGVMGALTCSPNLPAMSAAIASTRGLGVGALGADDHLRSALGREHHHAHDALAVHLEAVLLEQDVRREARRELHDLGRGTRVDSVRVHDRHPAFDHQRTTEMSMNSDEPDHGDAPPLDAAVEAREGDRADGGGGEHDLEDPARGPDHAAHGERNRDARQQRRQPRHVRGSLPEQRSAERGRDAQSVAVPRAQSPGAQRHRAGVE